MGKAFAAPAQKRIQNHFGIAGGFKLSAAGFEFMPQLTVIENFTVEDDNHVAIGADQRLVATCQIKNPEPGGAERNHFRDEAALMVRPAVHEGVESCVHHAMRQTIADVSIPEDATHGIVCNFLRAEEGENLSAPTATPL